ncbi:hypothetical protein Tco_0993442 [Tanacetum coccineum]
METENAQDVGRTRDIVGEEKENDEIILSTEDVLSTDKEKVSTDKEKVSTDRPIVSTKTTDDPRKGTEDHTEEGSTTQATQTPTSTIFRDATRRWNFKATRRTQLAAKQPAAKR